jgi:hypothetical protein
MRKLTLASLALAALALTASPAGAFGHRRHHESCCEPACCAPAAKPCVSYVERQVTCYRTEWRTREESCTINHFVPRTVVGSETITVCVPVWTEEQRTCTVYDRVARKVERDVTCCRMVPVSVTDPCSCCTRTCWRPETVVKHVTCTVYDCVPRQQKYTVKVCSMKQETRKIETRHIVCDVKPEKVTRTVHYCVTVPYQTTVKVPVCTTACAPTCCP